jgi:hypothetical protein
MAASARAAVPPSFTVAVKDPQGVWKGRFQAQLSSQGLTLSQKANKLSLPVGSPAHYLSTNALEVTYEGRALRLSILKFLSYQNVLARDLAAYLNGTGPMPDARLYCLPWYFYIPIALPVGIPIVTLGGAIPGALGFGLAGANFAIVQKERWPKAVRFAASLSLAVVPYLVLGLLLLFRWSSGVPESAWQLFSPPDGSFSVLLPGAATSQTTTEPSPVGPITTVAYLVDLKRSAYAVSCSVIPPAAVGQLQPEAQLDAIRDELVTTYKAKLLNEQKISLRGNSGRELALETGQPQGTCVVRVFRVGDRIYRALVVGRSVSASDSEVRKFLESFNVSRLPRQSEPPPGHPALSEPLPALAQEGAPSASNSSGNKAPPPKELRFQEDLARGYTSIKELLGEVRGLAFSGDGHTLAIAAGPDVQVVDLPGRKSYPLRQSDDSLLALAMTPDSKWIATGDERGQLKCWMVPERRVQGTLNQRADTMLLAVAFSPDGKRLAVGWSDGSVRLWDVDSWHERQRLQGRVKDLVRSLAFSRDGRLLASESPLAEKLVRLWDVEKGREQTNLPGGSNNPFGNSLALASDGHFLAALGANQAPTVWEVDRQMEKIKFPRADHLRCLALSPDDRLLAYGDGDGRVMLSEWRTGKTTNLPSSHSGGVVALAFSPDGKILAVGSLLEVRLWEVSRVLAQK